MNQDAKTKTLGQIAYEAAGIELIAHVTWDELEAQERSLWDDAAAAVKEAVIEELRTDPQRKSLTYAVKQWRENDRINKIVPLHTWLGMTESECQAFVRNGELPKRL